MKPLAKRSKIHSQATDLLDMMDKSHSNIKLTNRRTSALMLLRISAFSPYYPTLLTNHNEDKPIDILVVLVFAGKLATFDGPYQFKLKEVLNRRIPGIRIEKTQFNPVDGAVIEALKLAGTTIDTKVLNNISTELSGLSS